MFKCIHFLCFLPLLISADQNTKNITLGSVLTAGNESESPWIISPSGDFAFGFKRVGSSGGFLVAIWFDKIPEKTVTWSANRDELAQQGSKLQLTADGLVCKDPNGETSSIATATGVVFAAMLNTGNLILSDENSKTLWQSFNWPTDTVLPSQIMSQGSALIAQISDTNYSSGRFNLAMQADGNLVSYTLNWPQNSIQYFAYFDTSTVGTGYQVVFNHSGSLFVAAENGTVVAQVFQKSMELGEYRYQRAILESDGVFRRYVYPRSSPANWEMLEFQPENICKAIETDRGGGACGFNGYCQIDDQMKPKCGCPPGYSFFDETDRLKGCKRDFIPQSCLEEDSREENGQFELQKMVSTVFRGNNFETYDGLSETDCRKSCLFDCLCDAAFLEGDKCRKKRFPLSNGWSGPEVGKNIFIKVRVGNSTTRNHEQNQPDEVKNKGISHTNSLFLGGLVFLNILLLSLGVFAATFCKLKRKEVTQVRQDIARTNMRNFSYQELQEATDGFKEVIGQGAFAVVYKGSLDLEQCKLIAVKKLNVNVQENQREFESEINAIARTGHRNLVQLIGICNEEQHRLLVYEYMPNGSIADILFQGQRPSWCRRIKLAYDTARGLNYLHEECSIQIVHCDIKPQNVLLDEAFTAKISDFGLAKLLKKDQSHTLTKIRGTKGYVAPEWFRNMPISTKVDVYSYGILLLEIICCRKCFLEEMEDEIQKVLADWAFDCCQEGRIDKLVEGDDEALADIQKVGKLVTVALWCIEENPSHRPSMDEVVQIIKGEVDDCLPRKLASYFASVNVDECIDEDAVQISEDREICRDRTMLHRSYV